MATEKRHDLVDRGRLLRDPYFQEGRYPVSHLLRMAIKEQPTVDAVEVVRCKDCTRYKKGYCAIRKDSWGAALMVGLTDFCSDGERRTDEKPRCTNG